MSGLTAEELKNLVHIDEGNEAALNNAMTYANTAEQWLANAGCPVDYDNGIYKALAVALIIRLVDAPDMIANGAVDKDIGFLAMVKSLRLQNEVAAAKAAEATS